MFLKYLQYKMVFKPAMLVFLFLVFFIDWYTLRDPPREKGTEHTDQWSLIVQTGQCFNTTVSLSESKWTNTWGKRHTVYNLEQVYSCHWITGWTRFQIHWLMNPRVSVAKSKCYITGHGVHYNDIRNIRRQTYLKVTTIKVQIVQVLHLARVIN